MTPRAFPNTRGAVVSKKLKTAVTNHMRWRRKCLNLNAAESMISEEANQLLCSDLGRRAANGLPGNRPSEGGRFIDTIEIAVDRLLRQVYNSRYSEWRPMSASIADAILIHALTNSGESILATPLPLGHSTWHADGYAGFRGLSVKDAPFDWETMEPDYEALRRIARRRKYSLAIDGSSLILFPPNFDLLVESLDQVPLWYDGAHVMGLIAGNAFPNPLDHGALVLSGSTQKTLSGPLGGIIMTNDKMVIERVRTRALNDIATPDYGRIAALGITLVEWRRTGHAFARAIIKNAKALANHLSVLGVRVLLEDKGFTSTHQVALVVARSAVLAASKLSKANIVTTPFSLPDGGRVPKQVLRIGTTEITRQGFRPADMEDIAKAIKVGLENPETARELVRSLIKRRCG